MPIKYVEWAVIALFTVIAIAAAIAAIFVNVTHLMAANGWDGLKPGDWAAWVQAIGSIGAIVAAAFIASWQLRKASQADQLSKHRQRMVVMIAVLALAREFEDAMARSAVSLLLTIKWNRYSRSAEPSDLFNNEEEVLRSVPIHELPSAAAVGVVVRLRSAIPGIRKTILHEWKEVAEERRDMEGCRCILLALSSVVREQITEMERMVTELGGDPGACPLPATAPGSILDLEKI